MRASVVMVGMVGSLSADELGDAVAGIGSDFRAHHLLVGAAVDDAVTGADGVSLADDQVVVAVGLERVHWVRSFRELFAFFP